MRFQIFCVLFLASVAVLPAAHTDKSAITVDEPRYDPATEVSVLVVVSEVRDVPRGNPLNGIHLIARSEAQESQILDLYLGPTDFIKQFEITFAKGDEAKVTGSKVKIASGPHLILVREIRKDSATLSCRRAKGVPNWE